MKLTKFVHSCVLVEHNGQAILLDPGVFSWQSGLVDVTKLPQLNKIIVTHKHNDHLHEDFVRALVSQFPEVQWIAPPDAHALLKTFGTRNVSSQGDEDVIVKVGTHTSIAPLGETPQNLTVHLWNKVTDPGDSHAFEKSNAVLLLPADAPWGSTVGAVNAALAQNPRFVLPIHDYMWHETWRKNWYEIMQDAFAKADITLLVPVNGEPIEVEA